MYVVINSLISPIVKQLTLYKTRLTNTMVTAGIVGNDILVEFEAWAEVCSGERELLGFLIFKAVCKARLVEIVLIVSTIMTDKHTYNNRADSNTPDQKKIIQKSGHFCSL